MNPSSPNKPDIYSIEYDFERIIKQKIIPSYAEKLFRETLYWLFDAIADLDTMETFGDIGRYKLINGLGVLSFSINGHSKINIMPSEEKEFDSNKELTLACCGSRGSMLKLLSDIAIKSALPGIHTKRTFVILTTKWSFRYQKEISTKYLPLLDDQQINLVAILLTSQNAFPVFY